MDGYERLPNNEKEGLAPIPIDNLDENIELIETRPKVEKQSVFGPGSRRKYKLIRLATFCLLVLVSLALLSGSVYFIVTNERISKDYTKLCDKGWCLKVDMQEFFNAENNKKYGVNVPLLRAHKIQTLILTTNGGDLATLLADNKLINLKKARKQVALSLYLVVDERVASFMKEDTIKYFEDFDGFVVNKEALKSDIKGFLGGMVYLNNSDLNISMYDFLSGSYSEVSAHNLMEYSKKVCESVEESNIVEALLAEKITNLSIKDIVTKKIMLGFGMSHIVASYNKEIELAFEKYLENKTLIDPLVTYMQALSNISAVRALENSFNFSHCQSDTDGSIYVLHKSSPKIESFLVYSPDVTPMIYLKDLLKAKNRFMSYKMVFGIDKDGLNKSNHTVIMAPKSALWIHIDK